VPITDFITTTTLFRSPPLGVPSLTIPMCDAGVLTTDQATAWDAAYGADVDVVSLGPDSWQDALETLGFVAGDDLLTALTDMFSQRVDGQQSAPDEILLGRRATAVAQVRTVTIVTATNATTYTVTINGTSFAFLTVAETTAQIVTGLVALINAGTEPVTASDGAGDTVVLTADEAGVPFTSSVTHSTTPANITIATTTASVGYPEDIATWRAQDDRWYFLLLLSRSSGDIQAAAEVVEALTPNRLLVAQTDDALAQTGASTADLASELGSAGLGLTRTVLVWHDNDDQYVEWALVGKMCGFDPGVPNWVHQSLASVTGISAPVLTSTSTLETKRYTFLERYNAPVPPTTSTRGGKTLGGDWIDIIHGVDAISMSIQILVYGNALLDANQPYRGGEPAVKGAIHGVLSSFTGAPGAAFAVAGSAVVTVPDASTQLEADRLARLYRGVTWSLTAQGKVNAVIITGYLEQ
jgi:hypothetical protein